MGARAALLLRRHVVVIIMNPMGEGREGGAEGVVGEPKNGLTVEDWPSSLFFDPFPFDPDQRRWSTSRSPDSLPFRSNPSSSSLPELGVMSLCWYGVASLENTRGFDCASKVK